MRKGSMAAKYRTPLIFSILIGESSNCDSRNILLNHLQFSFANGEGIWNIIATKCWTSSFYFNSHGEGVQIMIAAKYWSHPPIFNERKSGQAHITTLPHNLTMRHIVNGRVSIHFFHNNYCKNMIMTFLANRCQINC